MKWVEILTGLVGKFKTLISWLLGYLYGKKVQRLEDENKTLERRQETISIEIARRKKVLEKWAKIRAGSDASRLPQPVRPEPEGSIKLDDSGSRLFPDRE